jgi:hypothetical protein
VQLLAAASLRLQLIATAEDPPAALAAATREIEAAVVSLREMMGRLASSDVDPAVIDDALARVRGLSGNPRDVGARENRVPARARTQGAPISGHLGATEDAAGARFAAAAGARGPSGQALNAGRDADFRPRATLSIEDAAALVAASALEN